MNKSRSPLDQLPADQFLELRDGLLGGWKYSDTLVWLEDACGLDSSLAALSGFYKRHCKPVLNERRKLVALKAEAIGEQAGKTNWNLASIELLKQTVFEFMSTPGADIKETEKLFKLLLKSQDQSQNERKLKLLEEKAERLEQAKKDLEARKTDGGLSEETIEHIERTLKML